MTHDPNTVMWRISTFSGTGSNCVAVADAGDDGIALRNSNHPEDGTIVIDRAAFAGLLADVKAGELDAHAEIRR